MINVGKLGTMTFELVRTRTDGIRSLEMIVIRNSRGHYFVDLSPSWAWTEDYRMATTFHNIRSAENAMKVLPEPFRNEDATVTELEFV